MARGLKKFHIFALFIFGIFFYAVINNLHTKQQKQNATAQSGNVKTDPQNLIFKHLKYLKEEIAEQKVISESLLERIRNKVTQGGLKPRNSKEVLGKLEKPVEQGKLEALQRELQIDAHLGEVRSDIDDLKPQKKPQKEDEFANGEVIDEQAVAVSPKREILNLPVDEDAVPVVPVLVFVCDRPSIKRSLDKLFMYRPSEKQFPIIVSQDCGSHPATTSVIEAYGEKITHIMQPDLSEIELPPKEKKLFKGYYKIARHYGWALNYTFNTLNYDNVIIVEDDIEVAPDFFEYFSATLPIMKRDSSIWCVSAWNDNGKANRINESAYDLLYRSDFFPGLGWMMTKDIWRELMVKWPKGFWDDWMREPAQRRNRVCIRPEISRTSTFGKEGVSRGTYFNNHLRFIKLNDHFVPFKSSNLSYLIKDNYDVEFVRRVYSSLLVKSVGELLSLTSETPTEEQPTQYRLIYRTKADFRTFAKKLELMDDFKAGVPRTAYRGVVSFFLNGHRCYLAPGANWESYQP